MSISKVYTLVEDSLDRLMSYCEKEDFKGWDPFDGLKSKACRVLGLGKTRFTRQACIQLFKRSPWNLRRVLGVEKSHNAKGVALFLSGYAQLCRFGRPQAREKLDYLSKLLINLQSPGYGNACWGYDFDWQSRAFFVPASTPNAVTSVFAARALLDAYEVTDDKTYLQSAVSCAEFLKDNLNRSFDPKDVDPQNRAFCFSYTTLDRSRIFNASLLVAGLLSRIYALSGRRDFKDDARLAVIFALRHQAHDGSWAYGAQKNQAWVDSAHTAYNLWALNDYGKYTGDDLASAQYEKGLSYYLNNFFASDGAPKFYGNSRWPVDTHSAGAMAAFLSCAGRLSRERGLVDRVLNWTVKNLQDRNGYFYYLKKEFFTNRIPYMRWCNAWMFYGLSAYLADGETLR